MQQRFAEARRDSAARAVALANGKLKPKFLGIFPRRLRARSDGAHEFREQGEDVWKAMRF